MAVAINQPAPAQNALSQSQQLKLTEPSNLQNILTAVQIAQGAFGIGQNVSQIYNHSVNNDVLKKDAVLKQQQIDSNDLSAKITGARLTPDKQLQDLYKGGAENANENTPNAFKVTALGGIINGVPQAGESKYLSYPGVSLGSKAKQLAYDESQRRFTSEGKGLLPQSAMGDFIKNGFMISGNKSPNSQEMKFNNGFNEDGTPIASTVFVSNPLKQSEFRFKNAETDNKIASTNKMIADTNSESEKDKRLPLSNQEQIKKLAEKNANLLTYDNQFKSMLAQLRDPSIPEDIKIQLGEQFIKVVNSAAVGSPDAVGKDERENIANFLQYQLGNVIKPGAWVGRSVDQFEKQMALTSDSINNSIANSNNLIQKARTGKPLTVPEIGDKNYISEYKKSVDLQNTRPFSNNKEAVAGNNNKFHEKNGIKVPLKNNIPDWKNLSNEDLIQYLGRSNGRN